jgi:hypothetical protein
LRHRLLLLRRRLRQGAIFIEIIIFFAFFANLSQKPFGLANRREALYINKNKDI